MTTHPTIRALALAAAVCALGLSPATRAAPIDPPSDATPGAPSAGNAPATTADTARTPMSSYDRGDQIFTPVQALNAMVASESALATRVGVDIMRQGGNAIDAAVAVGFAMAVTLPNAGNIGGGGFMLIHHAQTGADIALDFREMAPAAARRDMYLDAQGNVIKGASLYSTLAVGVPGTVAGLLKALEKYGTLPRETVMAPAIELARTGFPVPASLAASLASEADHLSRWPATTRIFFTQDAPVSCAAPPCPAVLRPLQAGEILRQEDLAATLSRIAEQGARGFYEGETAERIASDIQRHGGVMTVNDLNHYQAIERVPVQGTYRGNRIVSMPPPSSGGVHLIQLLNMLERYPMAEYGSGSAQTMHVMAEAMKLAYADRAQYMGDTDFVSVPVAGLLSRDYAVRRAAAIDTRRATPSELVRAGNPVPFESDQTTHYSVADAQGNVVSTTYTLNLNFGTGVVAEGTGVLLNNEMDDFSVKPGVANAFGLIGGQANAIAPGKRPLSSMTPVIVFRSGKPWMVTGSPGGSRIITTVLQTIVNAIDFGMNPAESAAAPRFHHQGQPDELRVERGFSPDTTRLLRAMGHDVQVKAVMGRTQTIERRDRRFYGASDPRNPDGLTAGF